MTAVLDFHYLIPKDVYSFRTHAEEQRNEKQFPAVWEQPKQKRGRVQCQMHYSPFATGSSTNKVVRPSVPLST